MDADASEVPGDRRQRWWKAAARGFGLSNTSVRLTAAELEQLEIGIDELLGTYVRRPEADVPADARWVRVLRQYLPEAGQ